MGVVIALGMWAVTALLVLGVLYSHGKRETERASTQSVGGRRTETDRERA